MRALLTILILTLSLAGASQAQAHPRIVSAAPAANSTVSPSLNEIAIVFNETLFVRFCALTLLDAHGKPVVTGPVTLDAGNRHRLFVRLGGPLPPGSYRVRWRAVSADTHRVEGAFTFTVN